MWAWVTRISLAVRAGAVTCRQKSTAAMPAAATAATHTHADRNGLDPSKARPMGEIVGDLR